MAQYSYENYKQKQDAESGKIKFFDYLKDDGDSVLVRFAYNSVADIVIDELHKEHIGNADRFINCIRGVNDPVTACPLCAKGNVAKGRIIVKMIVYVENNGKVEIVPCIWNRPSGFARVLTERITDYGNSVFKIKRIGAKGYQQTTYDILPANPQVYTEQAYPSDFSAFNEFRPNNFAFIDRNFDELTTYVNTGTMPERQKKQTNESVEQQPAQPQFNQGAQYGGYQQPQYQGYPNPQYQQPAPTFEQAEQNPFPQNFVGQQPAYQQPVQQPVYQQGMQPNPTPQYQQQGVGQQQPTQDTVGNKQTRRYY